MEGSSTISEVGVIVWSIIEGGRESSIGRSESRERLLKNSSSPSIIDTQKIANATREVEFIMHSGTVNPRAL
jgi:hypothetical protein